MRRRNTAFRRLKLEACGMEQGKKVARKLVVVITLKVYFLVSVQCIFDEDVFFTLL